LSTSENTNQPDSARPDIAPVPDSPPETAARLRARLVVCRRAYADLVAAGWAGLAAICDGDPDPWGYLVDELPRPPAGHPLIGLWDTRTTTAILGWGWGQ
jgi:hypothetical protein